MTKLHYVIRQKGITGKQLAERSGLSCSSIYKYLSGNRKLSLKTARKLCDCLNVPAEDIVGDVEEPIFL